MTILEPETIAEQKDEPSQRPKLVLFFSSTSGRSRRAEGHLAQVLQRRRNHDTFQIVRVNADQRPDLISKFQWRRSRRCSSSTATASVPA
jgi:thioredoxin-like negative regulator of GroEL